MNCNFIWVRKDKISPNAFKDAVEDNAYNKLNLYKIIVTVMFVVFLIITLYIVLKICYDELLWLDINDDDI